MRRRKELAISLCLIALGIACSTGTEPATANVAGTYDLVLFDGAPLPYTSYSLKEAVTYYGGTLTIGTDGRFTLAYDNGLGSTGYGNTSGSYRIRDSTVLLRSDGATGEDSLAIRSPALAMTSVVWRGNVWVVRGQVSPEYSYQIYELTTYDSHPLPYCTADTTCVTASMLNVFKRGVFWPRHTITMAGTNPPPAGTYRIAGDTIVVTDDQGHTASGTITPSGLSFGAFHYALSKDFAW